MSAATISGDAVWWMFTR